MDEKNTNKDKTVKKPINVAIGARVRSRREFLRLSRDELAEKADLSTRFIAGVEHGAGGLSTTTLDKIALALDISIDYLIRGDISAQLDLDFKLLLDEARPEDKATIIEILETNMVAYRKLFLNNDKQ